MHVNNIHIHDFEALLAHDNKPYWPMMICPSSDSHFKAISIKSEPASLKSMVHRANVWVVSICWYIPVLVTMYV